MASHLRLHRPGKFPIIVLTLLLSAVTLCGGAEPSNPQKGVSPAHAKRVYGERRKVKGIPNFGDVTLRLLRGGQPNHAGLEELKKRGVDIVVDTRSGRDQHSSEATEVAKQGMKYVAIPWHCPLPHDEPFAKFLKLMRDNPDKKVFVHCRLGDDRTGMMIAAYRMAAERWSADDAMLEMKYFGFSGAHHIICPRLAGYERSFPERLKKNSSFEGVRTIPAPGAEKAK
jgi:tyrosine-protein phosphatase SIW14